MAQLNSSGVIVGGLAGGLVMNVIDAARPLIGASSAGGLVASLAGAYVGARLYRETP